MPGCISLGAKTAKVANKFKGKKAKTFDADAETNSYSQNYTPPLAALGIGIKRRSAKDSTDHISQFSPEINRQPSEGSVSCSSSDEITDSVLAEAGRKLQEEAATYVQEDVIVDEGTLQVQHGRAAYEQLSSPQKLGRTWIRSTGDSAQRRKLPGFKPQSQRWRAQVTMIWLATMKHSYRRRRRRKR